MQSPLTLPRILFLGSGLVALSGAVLMGSVLAWKTSARVSGSNDVGVLEAQLIPHMNDTLLGPNGHTTRVALLDVLNTGDFNLGMYRPGFLQITGVVRLPKHQCAISNFSGSVVPAVPGTAIIPPGGLSANVLAVDVSVAPNAPASCEGSTVSWKATISLVAVR